MQLIQHQTTMPPGTYVFEYEGDIARGFPESYLEIISGDSTEVKKNKANILKELSNKKPINIYAKTGHGEWVDVLVFNRTVTGSASTQLKRNITTTYGNNPGVVVDPKIIPKTLYTDSESRVHVISQLPFDETATNPTYTQNYKIHKLKDNDGNNLLLYKRYGTYIPLDNNFRNPMSNAHDGKLRDIELKLYREYNGDIAMTGGSINTTNSPQGSIPNSMYSINGYFYKPYITNGGSEDNPINVVYLKGALYRFPFYEKSYKYY